MKKTLLVATVFAVVVLISACGGNPTDSNGNTNNKLTRVDSEEQMMKISEQLEKGEITGAEASKLMKKAKSQTETKSQELSKTVSNISEFKEVPSWAKKLGAPEVQGLKLNPAKSTSVKAGNGYTQYFEAVYTGKKDDVLAEANRIGKKLNLKTDMEMEGLLTLQGDLSNGYFSTVQVTYKPTGEAELLYNIHAEIVNSVKKPTK